MKAAIRNWSASREKFLKIEPLHRLGHIAGNLNRIRSRAQSDFEYENGVSVLVEESNYYIDWTLSDVAPNIASELEQLRDALKQWQLQWNDKGARPQIAAESQQWSEQLLNHSQLLTQDT